MFVEWWGDFWAVVDSAGDCFGQFADHAEACAFARTI